MNQNTYNYNLKSHMLKKHPIRRIKLNMHRHIKEVLTEKLVHAWVFVLILVTEAEIARVINLHFRD